MSEQFLIQTNQGYWRANAAGYTGDVRDAGRYTRDEAAAHIKGLGPEKAARIIPAPPRARCCKTCRWSDPVAVAGLNDVALCRVRPPTFSAEGATATNSRLFLAGRVERVPANVAVWPIVAADDWCADHEPQASSDA